VDGYDEATLFYHVTYEDGDTEQLDRAAVLRYMDEAQQVFLPATSTYSPPLSVSGQPMALVPQHEAAGDDFVRALARLEAKYKWAVDNGKEEMAARLAAQIEQLE
jgi:hypothetical protein